MTAPRRTPAGRISAVVSDVDGTLLTDDKTLTARTRAAVAALKQRGIPFSIISSRPPRGLRMVLQALDITTPVAGFNGGVLAGPDLAVIAQHALAPDVARRAVAMFDAQDVKTGVKPWVFTGQDWLVRDADAPYVALEARTVAFSPIVVADFGAALDSAAKIVGVSTDFPLLAQCEHDVGAALSDRASVARSQSYYLDITHPLANKGAALAELARLLAVPLAEIAVVGDGGNDVAMFVRAGFSIAMGNAALPVQGAADVVTDSNRNDGFAQAIERFILEPAGPPPRVEVA